MAYAPFIHGMCWSLQRYFIKKQNNPATVLLVTILEWQNAYISVLQYLRTNTWHLLKPFLYTFFCSYCMQQYFIIVSGVITVLPAITAMQVALSLQEEAAFQGDFLKCEAVTKINQTTFPFNLAFSGRLAPKFKAFPIKFGCIYV